MSESADAGKYQTNIDGTVQGQVTGDNNKVEIHIHNPQDKATSSTKPQRAWNIPYLRNDYFTGREEILEQLHTRFKADNATALSQRTAMSGLGGIGKTQTAVEYAYRYHQDYQAVLWARAESHETLTSSFVEIATLLDLPQKDEKDQTITVQAVKRWLQDNDGWLLILDNADEPKIVREFLPTKFGGHILLTTRAQALGGLAQRIDVDTFTPELGALFLLRRATIIGANDALELATSEDRELAIEISKELGGLPLALDQAGAYIEEARCSLSDYQGLYHTRRAEMLKERGYLVDSSTEPDYPETVATTWSISFQKVERANPTAAELLRFCAFLAPDAIPEEIITAGAEHLGPLLCTTARDPMDLNKTVAALGTYSLLRRDVATKTLTIHRLVQAVLTDEMTPETYYLWIQRTVLAISKAFPTAEYTSWQQCERCLPHAQACVTLIEQRNLTSLEVASLLHRVGWYLHARGRWNEVEPLYLRALSIREQQLGPQHPDTALSLNHLASLYYAQEKYKQAEQLYLRALSVREQQLGPQHPDTALTLNHLAGLYRAQGKYEKAAPLYQRALSIREQQLGPQHPETAFCLSNLAFLYDCQGEYEQAELLHLRALSIREQQLGPQHPDTALSLNYLASLYDHQGKYGQAEPLYLRALSIREQQLGPQHPRTAQSLNNLAAFYYMHKKYEQAEPLWKRALAIYEQRLGPDHSSTATSLNNLAELYRAQGKYEQAEPLLKRALSIDEKVLGPEHPDVATDLNNLAGLYDNQGKYDLAEPLLKRALTIKEQHLGPLDLSTATSINNLAGLYNNQNKYELALPLLKRAFAIYKQFQGPQHPDTKVVRQNYVNLLRAMGRDEEAKQLEEGNES